MRCDVDGVIAAYRHVACGLDALATLVGGRECYGDVAAADVHVAVAPDGGAVGRVVVGYHGGAVRVDDDGAAADAEVAVGSDAFGSVARMGDVEAAAAHVESAVALDALAVGRRRDDGDVGTADGDVGIAGDAV